MTTKGASAHGGITVSSSDVTSSCGSFNGWGRIFSVTASKVTLSLCDITVANNVGAPEEALTVQLSAVIKDASTVYHGSTWYIEGTLAATIGSTSTSISRSSPSLALELPTPFNAQAVASTVVAASELDGGTGLVTESPHKFTLRLTHAGLALHSPVYDARLSLWLPSATLSAHEAPAGATIKPSVGIGTYTAPANGADAYTVVFVERSVLVPEEAVEVVTKLLASAGLQPGSSLALYFEATWLSVLGASPDLGQLPPRSAAYPLTITVACDRIHSCNDHGACASATSCACSGGYTGSSCNKCDAKAPALACSGVGTCDGDTGDCSCPANYAGDFCEQSRVATPTMSPAAGTFAEDNAPTVTITTSTTGMSARVHVCVFVLAAGCEPDSCSVAVCMCMCLWGCRCYHSLHNRRFDAHHLLARHYHRLWC